MIVYDTINQQGYDVNLERVKIKNVRPNVRPDEYKVELIEDDNKTVVTLNKNQLNELNREIFSVQQGKRVPSNSLN